MQFIKKRVKNIFDRFGYRVTKKEKKVVTKSQVWTIGIYGGDTPFSFRDLKGATNPVLTGSDVTDIQAEFVADPFMINVENRWYMFFEVMNKRTGRGEIGLAKSNNLIDWRYDKIVLVEPFHLSYPYVFTWKDDFYMIPETGQTRTIRLYRANRFPYEWQFIETLISGGNFSDASPFYFNKNWWIFVETNPELKFDTLRLFYSRDLYGPWREHPKSPIVNGDPHVARPAGRIVTVGDKIVRYSQDCSESYGLQVRGFLISKLTPKEYFEEEINNEPILTGSGYGWNGGGMHHIDPHQTDDGNWIACVDGWYMG